MAAQQQEAPSLPDLKDISSRPLLWRREGDFDHLFGKFEENAWHNEDGWLNVQKLVKFKAIDKIDQLHALYVNMCHWGEYPDGPSDSEMHIFPPASSEEKLKHIERRAATLIEYIVHYNVVAIHLLEMGFRRTTYFDAAYKDLIPFLDDNGWTCQPDIVSMYQRNAWILRDGGNMNAVICVQGELLGLDEEKSEVKYTFDDNLNNWHREQNQQTENEEKEEKEEKAIALTQEDCHIRSIPSAVAAGLFLERYVSVPLVVTRTLTPADPDGQESSISQHVFLSVAHSKAGKEPWMLDKARSMMSASAKMTLRIVEAGRRQQHNNKARIIVINFADANQVIGDAGDWRATLSQTTKQAFYTKVNKVDAAIYSGNVAIEVAEPYQFSDHNILIATFALAGIADDVRSENKKACRKGAQKLDNLVRQWQFKKYKRKVKGFKYEIKDCKPFKLSVTEESKTNKNNEDKEEKRYVDSSPRQEVIDMSKYLGKRPIIMEIVVDKHESQERVEFVYRWDYGYKRMVHLLSKQKLDEMESAEFIEFKRQFPLWMRCRSHLGLFTFTIIFQYPKPEPVKRSKSPQAISNSKYRKISKSARKKNQKQQLQGTPGCVIVDKGPTALEMAKSAGWSVEINSATMEYRLDQKILRLEVNCKDARRWLFDLSVPQVELILNALEERKQLKEKQQPKEKQQLANQYAALVDYKSEPDDALKFELTLCIEYTLADLNLERAKVWGNAKISAAQFVMRSIVSIKDDARIEKQIHDFWKYNEPGVTAELHTEDNMLLLAVKLSLKRVTTAINFLRAIKGMPEHRDDFRGASLLTAELNSLETRQTLEKNFKLEKQEEEKNSEEVKQHLEKKNDDTDSGWHISIILELPKKGGKWIANMKNEQFTAAEQQQRVLQIDLYKVFSKAHSAMIEYGDSLDSNGHQLQSSSGIVGWEHHMESESQTLAVFEGIRNELQGLRIFAVFISVILLTGLVLRCFNTALNLVKSLAQRNEVSQSEPLSVETDDGDCSSMV